jgi:hypothetical protein
MNFRTESVQKALDKLIELVLQDVYEMSFYYSQSKKASLNLYQFDHALIVNLLVVASKLFYWSRNAQIEDLERVLRRHLEIIRDVFLNEILGSIVKANNAEGQVQVHQRRQERTEQQASTT